MIVPKKNRVLVYTQLFKDGVMAAKKDYFLPKHPDLNVPNLHVVKLMQSLTSRGYVEEKFSWQWYYWKLTDAGIEYLREYLHLSVDVVPDTHKKQATETARRLGGVEESRGPRRFGGDRDGYRGPKPAGGAPSEFQPQFGDNEERPRRQYGRGGFGRGGARGGLGRAQAEE